MGGTRVLWLSFSGWHVLFVKEHVASWVRDAIPGWERAKWAPVLEADVGNSEIELWCAVPSLYLWPTHCLQAALRQVWTL